jgi:asparagine synthase (glutamine-hydrolysing)
MCGIAGVVAGGREPVARARLEALGVALAHRGPDGAGTWVAPDGRTGFAHRRLAIIDLDPRSDQPMRSADGAVTVTYNGELYNHRHVRAELERLGHRFRTTSDTEVLVEALAAWGVAALPRLRGMFAFAAHDARTGEVVIARDALGIKPAYHARTADGDLVFASEVRALRPVVPTSMDPDAAIDLLLWGSIAAPRTSVAGVRALPAGHLLRVRDGSVTQERWADPVVWSDGRDGEPADGSVERLVEAISDSVRAHLIADVPVAVFLSSGVDSGVVASIAAAAGEVTALTVRDPDADESDAAAERARAIGVPHTVVDVPRGDARALAAAALEALDQPSVDGVNSFVIARAAAGAGFRVALSGVGGDELFGGYPSASRLPALAGAHRALALLGRLPATLLRRPAGSGWGRAGTSGRVRWTAAHVGLPHGPYLVARGVFAPAEVAKATDGTERKHRGGSRRGLE